MSQLNTVAQAKINLPKPGQFAPGGVPLAFDWTVDGSYDVNLYTFQGQGGIGGVQSMWYYNPSTGQCTITFGQSGQVVVLPAKSQGYIPVLMPNIPSLHITNAATDTTTQVMLLNFTVPMAVVFFT